MTLPLRALDAQLTLPKVHVAPFERHHLSAPQSGVPGEQHQQMRLTVESSRRLYQPAVLFEVGMDAVSVTRQALLGRFLKNREGTHAHGPPSVVSKPRVRRTQLASGSVQSPPNRA